MILMSILNMFSAEDVLDNLYMFDEDITDCQIQLYLFLINQNDDKKEMLFKKFEDAYNKLSLEKQKYIMGDYYQIIEEKERNIKKRKIK